MSGNARYLIQLAAFTLLIFVIFCVLRPTAFLSPDNLSSMAYQFPEGYRRSKAARGWLGQKQIWFAFRFTGDESEFDLARHHQVEFDLWRWERAYDKVTYGTGFDHRPPEADAVPAEAALHSWRSAGECLALDRLWWSGTAAGLVDVGSTKICCFIARVESAGPRILGIGHQVSRGVRGGAIVDLDAASEAIGNAVHAAEEMAGETIDRVVVTAVVAAALVPASSTRSSIF